jgi:hypothetical protein
MAIALFSPTSRAECPSSTFLYGASDPAPIVEVAAHVDTVFSIQGCDRVHGRYDVPAGVLIAAIDGACAEGLPSALETDVEDEYQLTGLAPGTPVAFSVVFHLRGEGHNFSAPGGQGGAILTATLLEGMNHSAQVTRATQTFDTAPIFVDEPLDLAIAAVTGTPIRLVATVRAVALDGRGELEGVLEFTGLPPGVALVSCRGYLSSAPVAAKRSSWGRLKAAYR